MTIELIYNYIKNNIEKYDIEYIFNELTKKYYFFDIQLAYINLLMELSNTNNITSENIEEKKMTIIPFVIEKEDDVKRMVMYWQRLIRWMRVGWTLEPGSRMVGEEWLLMGSIQKCQNELSSFLVKDIQGIITDYLDLFDGEQKCAFCHSSKDPDILNTSMCKIPGLVTKGICHFGCLLNLPPSPSIRDNILPKFFTKIK